MPESDCAYHTHAHAKLNLALAVGGAIDDPASPVHGYHPICSYMHAIDLCDRVEIERRREGQGSEYDIAWGGQGGDRAPVRWAMEHDLAARAHRAMEASVGRALPVRIRITKSIPAGGGLGGGSSDAASVLVGLDRLFGLGLEPSTLATMGAALGSDIPFFIDARRTIPRAAIVEGLGERIERLAGVHGGTEVTLVIPPFACATGAVYGAFDAMLARNPGHRLDAARVRRVADSLDPGALFNDLGPCAIGVEPRLGAIIERVGGALGVPVHITGSGSTLFVLGRVDAEQLSLAAPGCTVRAARLC